MEETTTTRSQRLAEEYIRQHPGATPEQLYLAGFAKALTLASQSVQVTITDEFSGQITGTIGPDQSWDLADERYQIDLSSILGVGSEIIDPNQPLTPTLIT